MTWFECLIHGYIYCNIYGLPLSRGTIDTKARMPFVSECCIRYYAACTQSETGLSGSIQLKVNLVIFWIAYWCILCSDSLIMHKGMVKFLTINQFIRIKFRFSRIKGVMNIKQRQLDSAKLRGIFHCDRRWGPSWGRDPPAHRILSSYDQPFKSSSLRFHFGAFRSAPVFARITRPWPTPPQNMSLTHVPFRKFLINTICLQCIMAPH